MFCCLFVFPQKVSQTGLMLEGRTATLVFYEAGGVTVVYGLWICAASVRRFFCNSGTVHGTGFSSKQLVILH
jgi:hypothetical protein